MIAPALKTASNNQTSFIAIASVHIRLKIRTRQERGGKVYSLTDSNCVNNIALLVSTDYYAIVTFITVQNSYLSHCQ
jgi:hypothetical protein